MILIIVRHGDTFEAGETPRRIGVRTDLPLVASGRAQGEALAQRFLQDGIRFDRALTSPLARARETTTLILAAQPSPPPIELAPFLAEIDHGPDEDRPEDAVIARIGAEVLARWESDAIAPSGWIIDRPERIAAWRALFADSKRSNVTLLVTSNGAARFALLANEALAEQASGLRSLKLRTGAWGRIRVDNGGMVLDAEAWDRRP